jgi:esterase/lipase superfamily enzyme
MATIAIDRERKLMNEQYFNWHSPRLGQQFETKRYGHGGVPMLAFPSSDGRFWDYADHGMIEAASPWIHAGKLQVWAVDGRDWESWSNTSIGSWDRAARHEVWESAVIQEVLPLIEEHADLSSRHMIVTGCSGGGYHAANFMLRHPDLCDTAICLSGVYSTKHFRTDHVDDYDYAHPAVYFNNPLHYLANMTDENQLNLLRESNIMLCCGQGSFEEECLAETHALSRILNDKGIRHWLDIWGHDVNHDWPWWRKQLSHFLANMQF